MSSPVLVILAILGLGGVFVLLPVALSSFFEHRGSKTVLCPETGGPATIEVDAGRATRGAIFGLVRLSVERCSRWPQRSGCAQGCVTPPAAQDASADPAQT
jgi:hypothetical protein